MGSKKLHEELSKNIALINNYRTSLERLLLEWSVVSVVAKVNNQEIGAQFLESISKTEKKFIELSDLLIDRILSRYVGQLNINLGLHSQAFIDILNRNLFERSADIGFLAQDARLKKFFKNPSSDSNIQRYLQEYIDKYTVYNDVILLDTNLNVLSRLQKTDISQSNSPALRKALDSSDFIQSDEVFDLLPEIKNPLIFAQKVVSDGQTLGVLCLCFKFEDELEKIYKSLVSEIDYRYQLMANKNNLFDSHNEPAIENTKATNTIEIDSQQNLRFSTNAKSYHGYSCLEWQCQISIELAKAIVSNTKIQNLSKTSRLYPHELDELSLQISKALNISISNGRVISLKKNSKSFLPILESYHEIGLKIREIFASSISHIHQIANQTVESEVSFFASIALDIMDRNLYERANDCRWWALNQDISDALMLDDKQEGVHVIKDTIQSINELYTVYECLFVFDDQGIVNAVSNSKYEHLVGKNLTASSVYSNTKQLETTQDYAVTNFEASEFYQQKPTYTYSAAIKNSHGDFIGGIGLAFESEHEFKDILNDFIPKDANGQSYAGAFSMFVDETGRIVSATDNPHAYEVNEKFADFNIICDQIEGDNGTLNLTLGEQKYLVGYQISKGYREYKAQPNNTIYCFVCVPS